MEARRSLSVSIGSSSESGTNLPTDGSYTQPFAIPPITPFTTRSHRPAPTWAISVLIVEVTPVLFLLPASAVTCRPTAGGDSVEKASRNAKRSRSCCVVLTNTGAARNSVRLMLPSWMKPKPRLKGVPGACVLMRFPLPFCRFGRNGPKPTFSYMLRRCGILKSWLSPSLEPLKRLRVVPSGRAWQVAHWKTFASSGGLGLLKIVAPLLGLPVTVPTPVVVFGAFRLDGSGSARLRHGVGGERGGERKCVGGRL